MRSETQTTKKHSDGAACLALHTLWHCHTSPTPPPPLHPTCWQKRWKPPWPSGMTSAFACSSASRQAGGRDSGVGRQLSGHCCGTLKGALRPTQAERCIAAAAQAGPNRAAQTCAHRRSSDAGSRSEGCRARHCSPPPVAKTGGQRSRIQLIPTRQQPFTAPDRPPAAKPLCSAAARTPGVGERRVRTRLADAGRAGGHVPSCLPHRQVRGLQHLPYRLHAHLAACGHRVPHGQFQPLSRAQDLYHGRLQDSCSGPQHPVSALRRMGGRRARPGGAGRLQAGADLQNRGEEERVGVRVHSMRWWRIRENEGRGRPSC